MCYRISQRALKLSTKGLRRMLCREFQRCWLFTGNWWQPVNHQLTGDASRNILKAWAPRQTYPQSRLLTILQVWNSDFWNVVLWIMQMSRKTVMTDPVNISTDSYIWNSAKASQRRPLRDLYKLGFIIASICGGLLLILTLYCLIIHKVSSCVSFKLKKSNVLLKFAKAFH